MNRADYMAALRRALSVLPEEERANALRYYEEYFDDAGPENEAKAIEELGEPAKVAAQILADYRELTAVPHAQPIKEKRRWRGISPLLLIVCWCCSPSRLDCRSYSAQVQPCLACFWRSL